MSNLKRNVYYIGVTSNIQRRVRQHKMACSNFTAHYRCKYLLYFETYSDIRNAIAREKQLKKWRRAWKDELIRKENPEMKDLAADW